MRAPVTWRVPPKSYVNVSDVRWVPGRQFDHPLSVVTPLRVRSTGYPASVNVADAVVVSKVAALDVVAVVTITARCAGRGPVGVVTVPGTRTTPTLAVTSPTPPQSQTTGNSKARGLVPTWAGTVAGAWAWTSASDAPTKAWVDTGSVSVKSPTSTNAAASKGVPNTSVPTPVTVTVPGTPQLSAPGRSHVTTTGVPAPHGYCGTTVDGNVGATPTAVATCTGDTDCNAVLRNVHLWWAPVLLAHVPTVVPGAVPAPAASSCAVVATVATTEQLDVAGEGTAPGTTVGTWASSTGAHQRWTFLSTALQSVSPVQVATAVGVAPTFPSTVVPQYPWGAGTPVVVTWDLPGAESWGVPGTVTVTGVGTDAFGTPFEAAAFVDVGDFTLTDPVSTHAFVGASLAEVQAQAPATVPAHVGTSPRAFEFPVVWDWGGVGDVTASVGVVRVPGTVTTPTGPLPAHLAVIVTTATTSNAATLDTTTASATFTEAGYPVDRTRNGVTTDKGWSNWRPGTQRTSDTLTYDFGGTRQVTGARIYFYADGSSPSWASSYLAEYRGPDGAWTPATSQPQPIETPATGAPVVEIDLGDVRADAVRFVLNATVRDGAPVHMVVSEVQIDVPVPTPSAIADLADLRVGGVPVDGFDPADDAYTVHAPEGDLPAVRAFALDGAANVAISQSAPAHHAAATVTVTVTAPDGSTSRTYTVTVLQPRITLTSLGGRIEDGDHLVRGAPILATVRRAQPGTRFVLEMDGQVLARATVSRGGTAVLVGAVPRRADLGEHILAVTTGATNIRSVQVPVSY